MYDGLHSHQVTVAVQAGSKTCPDAAPGKARAIFVLANGHAAREANVIVSSGLGFAAETGFGRQPSPAADRGSLTTRTCPLKRKGQLGSQVHLTGMATQHRFAPRYERETCCGGA